MTLQGSTNDFPLDVLLRLLADTKKTGELTIRGAKGDGALGLSEGQVVTAVFAQEKPIPALGAIFAIGEAKFEFTPWDDAPTANLEGTLEENRKRADEHAKWLASVREVIPHDGIRFRLSERAADQGGVTFTPDRWRVVMAVNTQPDVNQLAANLHIDRDEALTTLAGLVRDGVLDTVDAPPDEAAKPAPGPPPTAEYSAPEPAQAAVEPTAEPIAEPTQDWSAALLKEAETEAAEAEAPELAATLMPEPSLPESAAPEAAPSAGPPSVDAWSTVSPAPQRPAPDTSPLPGPTLRDWSDIRVTPAPKPVERSTPMPQDWSQIPASPAPEPAAPSTPMPQDWSEIRASLASQAPPASEPAMPDWGSPRPAENASTPPATDDRLTALDGMFNAPSSSSSAPASPDSWVAPAKGGAAAWVAPTPAAADDWNPPAAPATSPAESEATPQEEDPRLAAMRLAPAEPAKPVFAPRPVPAPAAEANEWGPPPADTAHTAAPAPKKGLFGGLFKKAGESTPQPLRANAPAAASDTSGSSRIGKLAAFSNALLGEYNSGQYGKGHIDERISGLLMRVDEQADPIDRPLPIVDDRLDVQALERVAPPEQQAVPYLALLITTIYGDAEKAFGRDKAKRGYKAAQQQVFGGDMSALNGPDLAGKLPRV